MALMEHVLSFEDKGPEEIKDSILKILEDKSYEYNLERFRSEGHEGTNIVLEIGSGKKEILIVCNYDSLKDSPSANSTASAIAVSLDLYSKLKNYQKKGMLKGKVKIILFGKEEPSIFNKKGRVGSKYYAEKHKDNTPNTLAVLNLKLCGKGNTLGISPVNSKEGDNALLNFMIKVFEKTNVSYCTFNNLSGISTISQSFKEHGFNNTFSLICLDNHEQDELKIHFESMPLESGIRNLLGSVFKNVKTNTPLLIKNYQTSDDKSSYLSEESLNLMSDSVFNLIVNIDRKFIEKQNYNSTN